MQRNLNWKQMVTKLSISTSQYKISHQNGKTPFPNEFFYKIWLILGECKYKYIGKLKKKIKKLFRCAFMGKSAR